MALLYSAARVARVPGEPGVVPHVLCACASRRRRSKLARTMIRTPVRLALGAWRLALPLPRPQGAAKRKRKKPKQVSIGQVLFWEL